MGLMDRLKANAAAAPAATPAPAAPATPPPAAATPAPAQAAAPAGALKASACTLGALYVIPPNPSEERHTPSVWAFAGTAGKWALFEFGDKLTRVPVDAQVTPAGELPLGATAPAPLAAAPAPAPAPVPARSRCS